MPFQKGQSGNPGGRPSQARQELSELLMVSWPVAKRKATLRKLAEMAEAGDLESARLLLAYAYGKPVERQEVQAEISGYIVDIGAAEDE